MRIGPGTSYPIRWVYHKRHLPVKIIEEFGNWRKVRDHEGEDGWIHRSLLSGHRTALVRAETIAFHLHPSAESPVIMQAKQNVLGHLQQCTLDWCRLDIQNIRGWAKKSELWGVFGEEIIEE